MKTVKISILLILSFLLQGCPEPEPPIVNRFDFTNSSSEDIYIYSRNSSDAVELSPGSEQPSIVTQKGERWSFPLTELPFNEGSKLWILVFKQSTLDTHTWQEIRDKKLYDKRYSFNLEEMKAVNYQITYDGN
jgi:hypothetical protein